MMSEPKTPRTTHHSQPGHGPNHITTLRITTTIDTSSSSSANINHINSQDVTVSPTLVSSRQDTHNTAISSTPKITINLLQDNNTSSKGTKSPNDSDDVDSASTVVPSRKDRSGASDDANVGILSRFANKLTESVINPATTIVKDVSKYYTKKAYRFILSRRDRKKHYEYLMDAANCYEQWAAAGYMLDRCEGRDKWKNEEKSDYYDFTLVRDRLDMLKTIRKAGDLSTMLFTLRTSLTRNLGEMGNPKLYAHTHVGTKTLIEDYIDEVTKQLNFICDVDIPGVSLQSKLQFFTDTQKSFGRTALLLSGGGAFGLSHTGVSKALFELKLLPRVIAGSSAGAIVAAAVCTRTDEELPYLLDPYNIQLVTSDVFEKPEEAVNPFIRLARFFKHGVFFDIQVLSDGMRENLGDITFLEAFNRTRRILNITVSSSTTFEMPRLLNYLTAPNVLIWSAVAASCALPFVFRSAPLIAKDKTGAFTPWNPTGHRCIDGSLENDLPMQRISELFGVNHFIVAQVNPHIIPFFSTANELPSMTGEIIRNVGHLAIQELQHRLTQLADFGISWDLLHRVKTILSQKYYGDITVVPSISWLKYPNLLTNPTPASYVGYTIDGERATWPKIAIARNHLQIEMCLNQNILALREKIVAGSKWGFDTNALVRRPYSGTPAYSTLTLMTNTSAYSNDRDEENERHGHRHHQRSLTSHYYLKGDYDEMAPATVSFSLGSPLTPGSADVIVADPSEGVGVMETLVSEALASLAQNPPNISIRDIDSSEEQQRLAGLGLSAGSASSSSNDGLVHSSIYFDIPATEDENNNNQQRALIPIKDEDQPEGRRSFVFELENHPQFQQRQSVHPPHVHFNPASPYRYSNEFKALKHDSSNTSVEESDGDSSSRKLRRNIYSAGDLRRLENVSTHPSTPPEDNANVRKSVRHASPLAKELQLRKSLSGDRQLPTPSTNDGIRSESIESIGMARSSDA